MQRKTVTILFCDVTGSTALGESVDPEALQRVLARYFERMSAIVELHGGTVEKFIGDAVMAVFGVPVAHEDDALRAVRTADAMRAALPELGIEARIGVTTGEVITDTEERLAAGDAVNVAARLEQAAEPGEVLIGEPTLALLRGAAEVEPVEPLALKGKAKPVVAYRLVGVRDQAEGRADERFVGRVEELAAIRGAWDRALAERRCEVVTVVGEAGVGKSRLVAEALASIGARAVTARCLPYGEGITYWPVVEVVRQIGALPSDEAAAAPLRALLGETDTATTADEIAWAFRKLIETTAPVVVVFDDIQWGEETFLDLVENLTVLASRAAILVVCLARPELSDRRPRWPVALRLEPLLQDDVRGLIGNRLPSGVRDRIAASAGGNPLFVLEMLALAEKTHEVEVPPTLRALLAARLDQLDPAERRLLERGAVEGEVFHSGAVQMLAPEEGQVMSRLTSLVRQELIRPDDAGLPGEDAFRFRHLLVRDAAYEALPKATRAELHERFADWLENLRPNLGEPGEIAGYHLEQAFRLRSEIWPLDEDAWALAHRASGLLEAAGGRALARNDVDASRKLLRRALALRPDDDPAAALRLDLTQALFLAGEFAAAGDVANDAATRAAAAGDRTGELRARLAAARMAAQLPRDDAAEAEPSAELLALAEQARPVFAEAGDEVGLTDAWAATAWAELLRSRWTAMLNAVEHAHTHARRGGYVRWERELPAWKATALFYGPTPVDEALHWWEQERPQHSMAMNQQAVLEAMRGRFDDARALLARADDTEAERGGTIWLAGGGMAKWEVETLAGDVSAAERAARRTCDLLADLGETGFRSLAAGQLAASLYGLDRLDEAERWTQVAEELSFRDDVLSNMCWQQVRAKLLARQGEAGEAERLALEAVRLAEQTDMINWHALALADLAEVYVLVGRREEALARLAQALTLYARKGNLVLAAKTRSELARVKETGLLVTEPAVE